MRNSLLCFCGMALFFAGLLACTKNDETTIVPIGTEYYVDDILEVIPDTAFREAFGPIHRGAVPPKVEGHYLIAPRIRIGTNMGGLPVGIAESNVNLGFMKQHNGLVVMDLSESTDHHTDTVFVMGDGQNFTAYCIEDKAYDVASDTAVYHVRTKRGLMMSGTVNRDGLADFRMAWIIMEVEDDSGGQMEQYPVGTYFIYKDGDGLSERIDNQ